MFSNQKVAPITYMNSSAAIKAFCGRNEGVVCTSSNAVPLFDIYLKEFDKMFFFPDQHLGRNTGAKFGIPLDKMALWNPHEELGGNTEEQLARSEADPLARTLFGPRTIQAVACR